MKKLILMLLLCWVAVGKTQVTVTGCSSLNGTYTYNADTDWWEFWFFGIALNSHFEKVDFDTWRLTTDAVVTGGARTFEATSTSDIPPCEGWVAIAGPCESVTVSGDCSDEGPICDPASLPGVFIIGEAPTCAGDMVTLGRSGAINQSSSWRWYKGSCGGTFVGIGSSVNVTVTETTTFYVRGEGSAPGCAGVPNGPCGTITVSVTALPEVDAGEDTELCPGAELTLTAYNPDGGELTWSHGGVDGEEFIPEEEGYYTVSTNLDGCESSDSLLLSFLPVAEIDAGADIEICAGEEMSLTAENPDDAGLSWSNDVEDGVVFSPSEEGYYVVTANLAGCESSDSLLLTILPTPIINAGDDLIVCEGNEVMLEAENPDGAILSWDNDVEDGIAFVPEESGVYTVTANLDGCENTDEITIEIHVVNTEVLDELGTLTAAYDGGTYQWVTCPVYEEIDGENEQSFTPSENGEYAVIIEDTHCMDTSDCLLIDYLGITKNLTPQFLIYPNPVKEYIKIDTSTPVNQYRIWDIHGRLLLTIDGTFQELDVQTLPNGIYQLEILTGGEIHNYKFVKSN